ncbi:DUF2125 domain-containing protein [Paracoccus indicus]|uniref:DUF2125 domain-containing protein n=1 Tax=Paracoccus indicus TaxID=2079229 RepID=UPI000D364EAC|nr:DUF2125 domain-containing protein [Paracoccus indicus]
MFRAIIGIGLCAAAVAGLWAGGETLASRRVAELIAGDPALQASLVQPLREPPEFGLRIEEPGFSDPAGGVTLPWAILRMSPRTPTTAHLDLPDKGQVTIAGQTHALGLQDPHALIRLAPLKRLAPDQIDIMADQVTLDGAPVIEGLDLELRMIRLGPDAPLAARAAYDAHLGLGAVQTAVLSRMGLNLQGIPEPASVSGNILLWLDGTPSVRGQTTLAVVGWQTEGLTVGAGSMSLRIVGRVVRDKDGLAEGQVALYTTDAGQIIDQAADMGLIPPSTRMLLNAGLGQLAKAQIDAELPGPDYPEPQDGQMRLPVQMIDGQIRLGGIPIGPAPPFGAL